MITFEDYLKVILKHEGGYVDHPSDPGGATKYGISSRFLIALGDYDKDGILEGDLDHDGDIDADDIRRLTVELAGQFYFEHFWKPLKCDMIKDPMLKLHIFDCGVNCGIKRAVKMVQKLIGVTDDGVIGNITLQAVNRRTSHFVWKVYQDIEIPILLWQEYAWARVERYRYLAEVNPKLSVFLKGWENRVHSTTLVL